VLLPELQIGGVVKRITLPACIGLVVSLGTACSNDQRVCRRMGELCGTDASACRALVEDLKRSGGDEAVAKLDRCYGDAGSCAAAKGCEARVTLESAASAVGDFFESLTEDEDER
jgi:hypothetical protein